jgi:hypothetical protein
MGKDQTKQPGQEEMFAISVTGEAIPRDLRVQDLGAVALDERSIHLINVLSMFDRVLELDRVARLYPIPKNPEADFVPTRQQAISRNSAKAAEQMRQASRSEFYTAYGVNALAAVGVVTTEEAEQEASKSYDRFTMRFAGKHKFRARSKAQEVWKNTLKQRQQVDSVVYDIEVTADATIEEKNAGLSTREKLIILAEAEDAGFLPTTNEEKNMVTTYLDYVNNEAFELGTQSQIVEVGNFHGKHHSYLAAKEYALQAGRSIAYEFADWLTQSTQQLAELRDVRELIRETPNPDLSLAVALHVDMLKAIPLIRFMDLAELRATGKVEYQTEKGTITPPFSLLRTRRNEASEALVPGKNKVLEDPYTGDRSKAVTAWLKARMVQIKVRDVRQTIEEAITDQENRAKFHKLVLEDLAIEKTDSEMLKEASLVAKEVLLRAAQV